MKFSFSEKGTQIWKNLPLVLTLPSKNSCFVKTGERFFQILWPSHNIWTLQYSVLQWHRLLQSGMQSYVLLSFSWNPLLSSAKIERSTSNCRHCSLYVRTYLLLGGHHCVPAKLAVLEGWLAHWLAKEVSLVDFKSGEHDPSKTILWAAGIY